jgi:hypothetical protein
MVSIFAIAKVGNINSTQNEKKKGPEWPDLFSC